MARLTSAGLVMLLLSAAAPLNAVTSQRAQLWFYLQTNLQDTNQFQFATNLLGRAAAAGYQGMVLADSKLEMTNGGGPYYNGFLQQFLARASNAGVSVTPLVYSFGHSESSIIAVDKNLAEPQPVVGTAFTVSADRQSLVFSNSFAGLPDGGFENHTGNQFTGWDLQDAVGGRTFADTNVFNASSNSTCSLRIDAGAGLARVSKRISVQPWRQYHVRVWIRTQNFGTAGLLDVQFLDADSNQPRNFADSKTGPFTVAATQPWTQYDYVCNSAGSTNINLALGLWNASSGSIWFDDLSVEEIALVNLVRRSGAPLRIYDAANTNVVYSEPSDVNTVSDPAIPSGGPFNAWHPPTTATLPTNTTSLVPGQPVRMDYYAVNPIGTRQVGACLTAPGIASYLSNNIAGVAGKFPTNTGFYLDIDELRHLNTCTTCTAMGQTAGGLLAWHLGQCVNAVRNVRSNAPIYLCSDMFDPYHNAISNTYYFVGGMVAGSWAGLSSNVVVMNWNHPNSVVNTNSLNFFAARGNRQFITGYYDTGTGFVTASNELRAAQGVPGFLGLMYTTWNNNLTNGFAQLENYASAAAVPTFGAVPTNLTVNAGQTATFTASATAPTPMTCQWQRNGVDVPGATNASYSFTAGLGDNAAQFACRVSDYGGWTRSDAATLTVIPPSPATFTAFTRQADGVFHLGFTGSSAFSYSVEASTNLVNWFPLTNGLPGTNGSFWFDDLAATNWPLRFYRAVWP